MARRSWLRRQDPPGAHSERPSRRTGPRSRHLRDSYHQDAWANKTGILEIDGSIDLLVKANLYRVKCSKEAFGGGLAFKLLLNRNETLGAGIERIVAAYE